MHRSGRARGHLFLRRARALARFLRRTPHEADFRWFARFGDDPGLFLDVGANLGMSALSARIVLPEARIVSLEPNPAHRADLRLVSRIVGNMHHQTVAAGAEPGELELHVPAWRGIPITGEASLEREAVLRSDSLRARLGRRMEGPYFEVRPMRVPVVRVDDLGLAPRWMKIDVQGAAPAVLDGARRTIAEHRPVLMIESDGATNEATIDRLGELGYEPFAPAAGGRDLVPFADQAPTNLMFLPT